MFDVVEIYWVMDFFQFNFSIKYRFGRSNRNFDDFSRKLVYGKELLYVRLEEFVVVLKVVILSEGSSFVLEFI